MEAEWVWMPCVDREVCASELSRKRRGTMVALLSTVLSGGCYKRNGVVAAASWPSGCACLVV